MKKPRPKMPLDCNGVRLKVGIQWRARTDTMPAGLTSTGGCSSAPCSGGYQYLRIGRQFRCATAWAMVKRAQ
jgi:hypothetical protein